MDPEPIQQTKKPWRPSAGTHEKRVSLRLNDDEDACLDARARAFGVTKPKALRLLISGYEPPVGRIERDAQRHIWRQVRGVAVNVNQVARRCNVEGAAAVTREEIVELRREVSRLVTTIRELAGLDPS